MSVLFVPACSRFLPAPEPTGRLMDEASGRSRVPPPVAAYDTILAAGVVPL